MRTFAIAVALVLVLAFVSQPVFAQGRTDTNPYGGLAMMKYSLPGAYSLLDRLDLTADQRKVLDEIGTEWSAKMQKAYKDAVQKAGTLTAEDFKDPDKVRAYQEKYNAAMKEAGAAPPIDQIANILTPDQLAKMMELEQVLAPWRKWVDDEFAKYSKQLDEAVGTILPGTADLFAPLRFYALEAYARGAGQLATRLALTKDQTAALDTLTRQLTAEYTAHSALGNALSVSTIYGPRGDSVNLILAAIVSWNTNSSAAKRKEGVTAILSQEQRDKIDRGVKILEERDKAVADRLTETIAKIDKILPLPKPASVESVPPTRTVAPPADPKRYGQ